MFQQIILYILVFISGLFFGSFLNLVSDRINKGKTILKGRSECEFCKKKLQPKNLIPLVSFILQKGKCDKCKKKLSWYYPISELLTGALFVGVAFYTKILIAPDLPRILTTLYLLVVGSFYVILFLTDMKERIIPNKIIYPAIIFVINFLILSATIYFIFFYNQLKSDEFGQYMLEAGYFKSQVFGALRTFGVLLASSTAIAAGFAFLVWVTKGRGMGGGDIRLGFLIGLFNGFPYNVIAIILGFILGAVISLLLIAFKQKTMKDTIAFGPFLIAGSLIAFIWGPVLLQWYITLL